LNLISDVAGVIVGHCTLDQGSVQTGVTVLHTHPHDPFLQKTPAAVAVINGFGKSVGLVQINELGVLETPIALTNTFSTGTVATAQIRQAIARHANIGRDWPTVNPLVFECNDGYLNDMHAFAVSEEHYQQACNRAAPVFAQGSVGAGRGMSSFSLKGGIGSASRQVTLGAQQRCATVGALVLSNFGRLPNLTVAHRAIGPQVRALLAAGADQALLHGSGAVADAPDAPEKGSIIMILATDAALDSRQLKRLAARAGAGLARTGSVYGHGSGDIALAFSTAYQLPADQDQAMPLVSLVHENLMDPLFEAAAEATEQAIVNALWAATTVHGRAGHVRHAITRLMPRWAQVFDQT
jgi:D-aminopeptidase